MERETMARLDVLERATIGNAAAAAAAAEKPEEGRQTMKSAASAAAVVAKQPVYEFSNLTTLAMLGSGTFGKVTLVQDKTTKSLFALKAMFKSEIVAHKQQTNVMNEKNVMASCNHPFVLRLFQTFKDSKRLYMLLEFVQGGELFSVIHKPDRDGIPDAHAKFYGLGVLLALAHLHSKEIAYRDMKPENCLIDKDGYPKLVDFGFAKVITGKSFTLCGTPEYLAPELVLGRGHNKAVDYWAFGILVYEMICGYSPFSDPSGNMDQVVICKQIVSGKLRFDRSFNADSQVCYYYTTRKVVVVYM
jgi:serine/threonine protein kinase